MGTLGDRMKSYEAVPKIKLVKRMPVIMRLDGKAFHTYTRGLQKPWDKRMVDSMAEAAKHVCENVSGAKLAYVQSDEISILFVDYEKIETQPWFDYQVQKMVSVAAALASVQFNFTATMLGIQKDLAVFDARVFNIPKEDVNNYFIWRQQDATRNSIQGLSQSLYNHKELQNKSCNVLQDMMFKDKGVNWNDCATWQKRGLCIVKEEYSIEDNIKRSRWSVDDEIPIFTQDRIYIDRYVYPLIEDDVSK